MTDSYTEGKRLAKEGDFEEALPLLEQASQEQSDSPDVWLALAACYFRMDRNDDFREAARRAGEEAIDPDHGPTRRFLKKTTGAEAIPAPDSGRDKIFMEAGDPIPPSPQPEETRKTGCLGGLLLLVGIGLSLGF